MAEVIYLMIRIGDYFNIKRGDAKNISNKTASDSLDAVRLLSSTSSNNGGDLFVIPEETESIYKNTLTINNNGSVGHVFYHPYRFIASSDVTILTPKDGYLMNEFSALYLKVAIKKQMPSFQYGYKISNDRLLNIKIRLPMMQGEIDWKKMEEDMRKIQKDIKKFPKTRNTMSTSLSLSSRKWKFFDIGGKNGILTISSGVRLTKANMLPGDIPFIGATDSNNGVTNWVSNTNKSLDKNVLGVNYNGSVVENFYHPYQAIFSDDVKRIHIRDDSISPSPEMYLFLKCAFLQHKKTYQYGFKFKKERMEKQKLLLPADEKGTPDWKFMEDYIKSLPNGDLISKKR